MDLSFHFTIVGGSFTDRPMQLNLSQLIGHPNCTFASLLLACSLFGFLQPHHTNSANARKENSLWL